MSGKATFWIPPEDGERWTARAAQAYVGRGVRYGQLGTIGEVEAATPVDAGRSLRIHVALSRKLTNPDRRKFSLAPK